MKKIIVILFGICMVAFIGGCAHQSNLTEEEKLDVIVDVVKAIESSPIDISEVAVEWTYVTSSSIRSVPIHFYSNPNEDAEIGYVCLMAVQDFIIGYTYLLKGIIYAYVYDEEADTYKEISDVNQEQWLYNYQMVFGIEST